MLYRLLAFAFALAQVTSAGAIRLPLNQASKPRFRSGQTNSETNDPGTKMVWPTPKDPNGQVANGCPWSEETELYPKCSSAKFGPGIKLFYQPGSNDNSCGIRQLLFARNVLGGGNHPDSADTFCSGGDLDALPQSNFIPVWQNVYNFNHKTYAGNDNKLQQFIDKTGGPDSPFYQTLNRDVPSAMTADAVIKAKGGTMSMPSSLAKVAKGAGYDVTYHYDMNKLKLELGQPSFMSALEALIKAEADTVAAAGITVNDKADLGDSAALKRLIVDPTKYYMFVIRQGGHWVGTTTTAFYNSGCHDPVSDIEWEFSKFSGIVIEIGRGQQEKKLIEEIKDTTAELKTKLSGLNEIKSGEALGA